MTILLCVLDFKVYFHFSLSIVAGSFVLNSFSYDAFEADGAVRVCAVFMAEALERTIVVQLSSQDSTARSKFTLLVYIFMP